MKELGSLVEDVKKKPNSVCFISLSLAVRSEEPNDSAKIFKSEQEMVGENWEIVW